MLRAVLVMGRHHRVNTYWSPTLRLVSLLISLLILIGPWLFKKYSKAISFTINSNPRKLHPKENLLANGVAITMMPAVIGFLLFKLGGPASDMYYFAGISLIGTLSWGIYLLFD
jgi:hypothetical protein